MLLKKTYENLKGNPDGIVIMEKMLNVMDKHLEQLKVAHPDKYSDLENCIYVIANGYHFNADMLDEYLEHMVNDDGTPAPKWTVAETTTVARQYNIKMDTFNEYDFNYVMNMLYSDYVSILSTNVASYAKMADKFLHDKDAPEGKALRYAISMKKDYE